MAEHFRVRGDYGGPGERGSGGVLHAAAPPTGYAVVGDLSELHERLSELSYVSWSCHHV